jgi:tripartite-type tricarboxylate transporter receptor subunit TctC
MNKRNSIACALALAVALPVLAQTYPTKPIRVIVPYPQGWRTSSRRMGCFGGGDGVRPPGFMRWLSSVITKFACALALAAALPVVAQTYPSKPIRVIVPYPQGWRTGSRRMGCFGGGDGVRPPGFVRWLSSVITKFACALALAAALPVVAQTYPSKPIRVIVPYPPGGTSDILTRLIGAKLTANWGQQVIADNRAGANGNIGAEITVRANPDAYTLLLTDVGNLVITSILYTKLPFDALKDLTPVTTISYSPHLLLTHPSVPVKTTGELIAYAKAQPGKLNYATALGGAPHLAGLMFEQRTGIKWVYVPTKGGSQSSFAVTTGDAHVLFLGMLQSLPQANTGKLRLIAVSSEKRMPNLPDTPTVAETLPGFVTGSWQGVLAPARTPPALIAKLNAEIIRILALPDVKEMLSSQGTTPLPASPQDTSRWLASEKQRWIKVVTESGFKLE